MDINGWRLKTWKININKLKNWKRLDQTTPKELSKDCTLNTLSFLGVLDSLWNEIDIINNARSMNINKNMASMSDILSIIYDNTHLVNREKYTIQCAYDILKPSSVENIISACNTMCNKCVYEPRLKNINFKLMLNNNEFTILNIHRYNDIGHSVVLGKYNDELYIIDPQQETYIKGSSRCVNVASSIFAFEQYLIDNQTDYISYIFFKYTGKRIAPIKRRSTDNNVQKKKRLFNGGRKKKSIRKKNKKTKHKKTKHKKTKHKRQNKTRKK